MIQWKATAKEYKLISLISVRASKFSESSRMSIEMDLDATHSNGCSLDFEKLMSFDDFNFMHDIQGIQTYINRDNGRLENCFRPRCAK